MSMVRIILSVALVIGLTGCSRVANIYNVQNHEVPPIATKLANKEIGQKIIQAAAYKGWDCKDSGNNKLACSLQVREHHADVEIIYNHNDFSINLLDSKNLKGSNGKIHRNYNKWIKSLEKEIVMELAN